MPREPQAGSDIDRERRLDAILAAYLEAVATGTAPDREALIDQHPDLAGPLRAFFADYDHVHHLARPMQAVARAGASETATEPAETVAPGSSAGRTTDPGAAAPPQPADGQDADLPRNSRVRYFGDYEVRSELGRGGMGVVYKAKQLSLNRLVALKMIRAGLWAGDDEVRRFRNEAEAVANLDHPRIVTIHEVGQYEGRHYFSMRLVEGPSLEKVLEGYAKDPGRAARLVAEVARAVHHAHQRGILHRDLKPSNILLDREGHPHVTDFGLARRLEGDGSLSVSGSIVGTPQYMSPEQASGSRQAITTAADVYGLGALLYAALTGRPPFQGDSAVETLRQVQDRPVEPPSRANRKVARDLETICLKCLEKDPRRRYGSAESMAADLDRYLRGEPIQARRTSVPERVVKWARRRPAVAVLLAGILSVTIAGLVGVIWQWRRAEDQRDRALRARNDAVEARRVAERQRQESQQRAARLALDRGLALCQQGEIGQGMLWFARGLELAPVEAAHLDRVLRTNLDGWSRRLHTLKAILPHDYPWIRSVAFSPDGKLVLTSSRTPDSSGKEARLWDGVTGRLIGAPLALRPDRAVGVSAAIRPDGKAFLTDDGHIQVWDTATLRPVGKPLRCPNEFDGRFSPDGRTILGSNDPRTAQLFDAATGRPVGPPLAHPEAIYAASFSPDGTRVATGCEGGLVMIWDAETGEPVGPSLKHPAPISDLTFSPDGKLLLTGCRSLGSGAHVWDVATGRLIHVLEAPHADLVIRVAFSPDGSLALTGSNDRNAQRWEVSSYRPKGEPLKHQDTVTALAFSPDSRAILTGCMDAAARAWDTATGRPIGQSLLHSAEVDRVAISPDGRRFLTGGRDGTVRLWERADDPTYGPILPHHEPVSQVAFNPAGRVVLTASLDYSKLVNPRDLHLVRGEAHLWEAVTGRPIGPPLPTLGPVRSAAFSPDGRTLVTGGFDKVLRFWDATSGAPTREPVAPFDWFPWVTFRPDGKVFLTVVSRVDASGIDARLWDVETGRTLGPPLPIESVHGLQSWMPAFRPDSRVILAGDATGQMGLWDASTGRQLGTPFSFKKQVISVTFHPDSATALVGGYDGTVQRWNVTTGKTVGEIPRQAGVIGAVEFSPDGHSFLTVSADQHAIRGQAPLTASRAQLWDTSTDLPLGPPLDDGDVVTAAFSPDGSTILTGSLDRQARFWLVPMPIIGELERIVLWIQVSTGLALTDEGKIDVLDARNWDDQRRRLEELGGPPRR